MVFYSVFIDEMLEYAGTYELKSFLVGCKLYIICEGLDAWISLCTEACVYVTVEHACMESARPSMTVVVMLTW